MKVLGVLVICAVNFVRGGLAPFITPCHASDTACHISSIQAAVPTFAAGVPALGLAPLDPMELKLVNADQNGLHLEFRDTLVKGLRNCQAVSFRRSGNRHNIELQCSVTLIGNYTLGGRLLILPVDGDGRYKIKIRDIVVKVQYEMGEAAPGGEQHWHVKSWKHSFDVRGGAKFEFENLFNGNKQLADTVHQFANDNWKDIFQEVAPPIVKAIVARIVGVVASFFKKVPLGELALD